MGGWGKEGARSGGSVRGGGAGMWPWLLAVGLWMPAVVTAAQWQQQSRPYNSQAINHHRLTVTSAL